MQPLHNGPSLPQVVEHVGSAAMEAKPKEPVESAVSSAKASGSEGKVLQPSAGDEVRISFEHGDPRPPILTGTLWNTEAPPADAGNATGQENDRLSEERAKLLNHQLKKLE